MGAEPAVLSANVELSLLTFTAAAFSSSLLPVRYALQCTCFYQSHRFKSVAVWERTLSTLLGGLCDDGRASCRDRRSGDMGWGAAAGPQGQGVCMRKLASRSPDSKGSAGCLWLHQGALCQAGPPAPRRLEKHMYARRMSEYTLHRACLERREVWRRELTSGVPPPALQFAGCK